MGNNYLQGNFAPVREELTVTDLPVTGTIPEHLDGRYLRNGPNPIAEVDPATYHWFTGDGMVHGVRLRDGKAQWYRNRWIRSPEVARILGEPAPTRHSSAPITSVGANTNVISHAGRTLALVEGGMVNYELTEELDTVGPCDFDATLPGGYNCAPQARPGHRRAARGVLLLRPRQPGAVLGDRHRRQGPAHRRRRGHRQPDDARLLPHREPRYLLRPAGHLRPEKGRRGGRAPAVAHPGPSGAFRAGRTGPGTGPDRGDRGEGIPSNGHLPYAWNPTYPARVGVMPRDGDSSDVRWFDIEPCYVFHLLNAYDSADGAGDTIVLDVIRHPKMFATDLHGPNEGPPTLDRWTVDLADGKVREHRLDDRGQEFPRVDERLIGRRHRYGYAMQTRAGTGAEAGDSVLKHDLVQGNATARNLGQHRRAGEFVFVPNHPDAAEDDGVLMGFSYDTTTDRSDLTILDAGTLETVASVHLPARVPDGFHGNWAPTG